MYMNMQGVDEKCSSVLFSPKASQQSLHANNDLHPADRKTPCILWGQSRHTASHHTNTSRVQAYASRSRSAEQARTLLRQWRCWWQCSMQQLNGKEKIWKLSKFNALVAQHISNNLLNWFWSVPFKMKKKKFDRASTSELMRQVVGSLPACSWQKQYTTFYAICYVFEKEAWKQSAWSHFPYVGAQCRGRAERRCSSEQPAQRRPLWDCSERLQHPPHRAHVCWSCGQQI